MLRAALLLSFLGCALSFATTATLRGASNPDALYTNYHSPRMRKCQPSMPAENANRGWQTRRGRRTTVCNLEGPDGRLDRRYLLPLLSSFLALPALAAPEEDLPRRFAPAAAPWEGIRKPVATWELEGGVKMPILALNTVDLSVEGTERAVALALKYGITHIDFHPGIERDGVAAALASGVDPSSLFLTTKIKKPQNGISPAAAAKMAQEQIAEDLSALGLDAVDMLMLRDSTDCEVMRAQWKVLEGARAAGQCRAIGVVNFCQSALECLLKTAEIKPSVNYFMLHAGMGPDAHGLRTFGEKIGIRTFAYGAIGEPAPSEQLLSSKTVRKISNAHQRTPVEVCVKWALQSGVAVSVRPTSDFALGRGPDRPGILVRAGIKQRAELFNWSLKMEEMAKLDEMTAPDGNPTLFSSDGCPGNFQL